MLIINTLENVKSRLHFWTYVSEGNVPGIWSYSGAQEGLWSKILSSLVQHTFLIFEGQLICIIWETSAILFLRLQSSMNPSYTLSLTLFQ